MLSTIVGHVGGPCKGELHEGEEWATRPPTSSEVETKIHEQIAGIFRFVKDPQASGKFNCLERGLVPLVFALGRLFLTYALAMRSEASEPEDRKWLKRGWRRREKLERKILGTFFGKVCFWRTYIRKPGGNGIHPLDVALGLTADGFSPWILEMGARMSTLLTYEQVTAFFLYFLSWSPSKTTVEKAVLGYGRHTAAWFEAAPPPLGDGEYLIIQVDSKATTTATEEELQKRRGKREKRPRPLSPRHRGRAKRARRGPRKRRAPGDKSKNGRAATLLTIYTLKLGTDEDGKRVLLGPINKRVYASYGPKRHAFEIARREADKRGFPKGCGKVVQVVTDGDEDLERYVREFFPEAIHTLDVMHVLEYLWEAARLVFKEGSPELTGWVKRQETLLYRGKAVLVLQHVVDLMKEATGRPRERLDEIRNYLGKRVRLMNYDELRAADLEVASGAVEGGVRHVIAKRFDHGSMRWIRERAEALLQLRCIEVNGDWAAFVEFVDNRMAAATRADDGLPRILTTKPAPVPQSVVAPVRASA